MAERELPFQIGFELADRCGTVNFIALSDDKRVALERYKPGNSKRRGEVAKSWAGNDQLRNGRLLTTAEVSRALEKVELQALPEIEKLHSADDDGSEASEAASYVDDDLIIELTWNEREGKPDFSIFDRETHAVTRADQARTPSGVLCPPKAWRGIVAPGWPTDGSVYVPTQFDEAGLDEDHVRDEIQGFVHRYVELSEDTEKLCVEYVLMTWIYDGFSELPYLCFRTSDIGRGKSRALLTVGVLCRRPMIAGGGSTAAALRRILDIYRGTLVCDEFDAGKDTELTSIVTKILNQGFECGRPMLLCEGESNTPVPYYVFGPKILVLRGTLGDDASESRTISIRMKQRTRDDVPINLPKVEFYSEALTLRNQLLAWRCANLGKISVDPAQADPELEDRLNQIGAALFAVAGNPGRDRIVRALRNQQQTIAEDRADSLAGKVFDVVLASGGTVRPGAVAKDLNELEAEALGIPVEKLHRALTPHKIGPVLKGDLELTRVRDRSGTFYQLTLERGRQLCQRFAVPLTKLPPLPQPENDLFDSAKADVLQCGKCGNLPGVPAAVSDVAPQSDAPTDDGVPF